MGNSSLLSSVSSSKRPIIAYLPSRDLLSQETGGSTYRADTSGPLSLERRPYRNLQFERPALLSSLFSSTRTQLLASRFNRASENADSTAPADSISMAKRITPPDHISLPASPYGANRQGDDGENDGMRTPTATGSPLGVPSPYSGYRKISGIVKSGNQSLSRDGPSPIRERGNGPLTPGGHAPIPQALPHISTPQNASPLPTLPLIVLCYAMISEFLSASVAGPFIFFFLEDVGVGKGENGGGEAAVGFWAGIVSSAFFLTQFLTSLLWANMAGKYGRRAILFTSLLGNAVSLVLFGSSGTLVSMICARLAQGVFNGAIGVARGAVRDITDPSNEGRAMSFMGVCWGLGGIIGPILGGLLEHPAENYPGIFGRSEFLKKYPYILPCLVASAITFTGSVLSLFLGYDGGPREGAIRLPGEKPVNPVAGASGDPEADSDSIHSGMDSFRSRLGFRVSGISSDLSPLRPSTSSSLGPNSSGFPLSSASRRQSAATGSAYGYEPRGFRSQRLATRTSIRRASVAQSVGGRSAGGETQFAPDYDDLHTEPLNLNFAQRLLLANEDAVFGLHDVWLAAAATQDRDDDEYSQMDVHDDEEWQGSVFEDDESRTDQSNESDVLADEFGFDGSEPPSVEDLRGRAAAQRRAGLLSSSQHASPANAARSRLSRHDTISSRQSMLVPQLNGPTGSLVPTSYTSGNRFPRPSISSQRPTIFSNTGLATPPLTSPLLHSIGDAQPFSEQVVGQVLAAASQGPALAAIPETRPVSYAEANGSVIEAQTVEKKTRSVFAMLPLAIIAQYAVLALHGTTCDQLFMSFLVTPVNSGGLGLSAGHYAELIAAMCVAQIMFQFRFYPQVGPPRGSLSHLAMFRLGLSLYIPVYLLLPELRGLLRDEHNGLVMFGMILLSTFRWLANVCAYTAVMVLINALTPPHLIPFANGLAQSAVSAARFAGPLLGGIVWSASITPSPDARPYPFNNALGFVTISCICFLGLLTSLRLK